MNLHTAESTDEAFDAVHCTPVAFLAADGQGLLDSIELSRVR